MNLEHKALGTYQVEDELKHRHIEAFYEILNTKDTRAHAGPYGDRAIIEAAQESKVLLDKIDVMESSPALTNWLASALIDHINKARAIPKN